MNDSRKRDSDVDSLKIPPHSIEAEQALIGGIMLENQAWDRIADKVQEKDFYRADHRLIFRVIAQLVERDQPLDVLTVAEQLKQLKELENAGGEVYLFELAKNTPSAANIAAYADIVRERSIARQLLSVASEIANSAYHAEGRRSNELLDDAERRVFEIAQSGGQDTGPQDIKSLLSIAVERIDHLFTNNEPITGLATGFTDFDDMTAGLQAGDLIVVAGRPSMGKTVFGINMAEHAAIKSKKPVLVFSLEMPGEAIAMRLLSSLGRIDQSKVRTGRLQEEDWPRITSAVSVLSEAPLFIDDTPALTATEIRARARRLAREQGQLGLIVVDYLQLMGSSGNGSETRANEVSEMSRALKSLAKELHVPVIALSQLNRSLEQRHDRRPVMSDLRESGAIEQDADLIVFIYRDEVYHEDSPDKGTAEIIIAKQRNGPIGKVRLTFLGQYVRFDNFTINQYSGYNQGD